MKYPIHIADLASVGVIEGSRRGIAFARFKKPHKHFMPGDLFVGDLRNGRFQDIQGWGWSSKHRRIVGGKWGYQVRFCGLKSVTTDRERRAARSALRGAGCTEDEVRKHCPRKLMASGAGHLRIFKWIHGLRFDLEFPPQSRNETWLKRLLIELSCGTMPLRATEAAPSRAFTP